MKRFVIFIVALFVSLEVSSQEKEIKIESLALSSGQGPLSSGLFFEANFSRGNDLINLSLGEKDMYVVYFKKIWKFHSGPSFEYYYNVPTLGIMTIVPLFEKKDLSVSTMNWSGICAGEPAVRTDFTEWRFLFFWHSLDVGYKRFSATGAFLWYDEWGKLFDLKYTQPMIKQKISIYASGGYSFYKEGNYMFKIGIKYKIN